MRRHQFVPTALGPLEDRVVLSAAAANIQGLVHTLAAKLPSFSGGAGIHLKNTLSQAQGANLDTFKVYISGLGVIRVSGQLGCKGVGQPVTGAIDFVIDSTNERARLNLTAPYATFYCKSTTLVFDYEVATFRPGDLAVYNGATGHLKLQTSNVSNYRGAFTIKVSP